MTIVAGSASVRRTKWRDQADGKYVFQTDSRLAASAFPTQLYFASVVGLVMTAVVVGSQIITLNALSAGAKNCVRVETGHATNIIAGLAAGHTRRASSWFHRHRDLLSFHFAGLYGIAIG